MTGKIGNIKAKCPSCGKTTFESSTGKNPKPEDNVTCAGCGRVFRYRDLVAKVGAESKKLVNKMLEDIIKDFNRRK